MSASRQSGEPPRMGRQEFRAWAEGRPGRWERVDGAVLARSPERVGHGRAKFAVALALDAAVAAAGAPCEVLPNGATVEVGDDTDFEPDAVVACGPRAADGQHAVPGAAIVVEVLSPPTARRDLSVKLAGYFRVPSVHHYLPVDTETRSVVHHRRAAGDALETRVLRESGPLRLDPPGLVLEIADFFRRLDKVSPA
jgi:Uma2 family endonuclease